MERAKHVGISSGAIEDLAGKIVELNIPRAGWDTNYHLPANGETLAQYIFVLDVCNFCFWGDPKWRIEYRGEVLDGYWAEAAALRRAVEEGVAILDADYLSRITIEGTASIFRGNVEIPMLPERTVALQEAGGVLLEQFDGSFANAIAAAGPSAGSLVELVVERFSSFDDRATYEESEVRLYKRAQILAADLYLSGAARQVGVDYEDIGDLTAFADYKVPQVLRAFGALEYSSDAAALIDNQIEIAAGSSIEVEIRAATIQAVELLKNALAKLGEPKTSVETDWMLWNFGQGDLPGLKPYHRTRTIYY